MAEAKRRIYLVPIGEEEMLVRTYSPARATRIAVRKLGVVARLASQDDIVRTISAGVTIIEDTDPQADLPLDAPTEE